MLQVPDLTQTEIWSVAFATVCQPWAPFRCVDLDRIDRGSQAAFLPKQETRRWSACFALLYRISPLLANDALRL